MKRALHKIGKWFIYLCAGLFLIVILVLVSFSIARMVREKNTSAEIAPAGGHFVTAAGIQIFVQETGPVNGPAILLVHGTGIWSEVWRDTITPLTAAGYHVIAIDLPPFGFSEKPKGPDAYSREHQAARIIGVLDALNIPTAILMAHSVGSRSAVEAALKNPSRVSELVLVDPALGFGNENDPTPHFAQNDASPLIKTVFGIPVVRDAVLSVYGTSPFSIRPLFNSFVARKDSITEARLAMIKLPMSIKGTTTAYGDWLENLTVAPDNSLGSDFGNFKNLYMPILLVWGDKDTVTPLWQGKQLATLMPGSQLSIIEGVGHIPFIEDTEAFNKILFAFLKK